MCDRPSTNVLVVPDGLYAAMDDADSHESQASRMRAGVRDVVRRMGTGVRRYTGASLLALLCAGAFGPLLGTGAGAVVVAGIGVLGNVGSNVLSQFLERAIDRLRAAGGRQPTVAEIEQELLDRIAEALAVGDDRAAALIGEIAAVLREAGVVGAALQAAVETGDEGMQQELTRAFAELGTEFAEFGFVLAEVRESAGAIQDLLRRQELRQRADRERARRQSVQLRLLLDQVNLVERRIRPSIVDAVEVPLQWAGCPYRGLLSFEEDHAEVFYGREQVTAELVGRVAERLSGPGVLVVTGASGVGKSSLLRAGLMPAVARGLLSPEAAGWPRIVLTPTRDPLEELGTHLQPSATELRKLREIKLPHKVEPRRTAHIRRRPSAGSRPEMPATSPCGPHRGYE
jgi:hypothetical protein